MDSRCLWIGAVCCALPVFPAAAQSFAATPTGMHAALHRGGGYLGVSFEDLTSRQRAELGVGEKAGVVIAAVDHDAPAGEAGLRPNDVVLKLNGKATRKAGDLQRMLAGMAPGKTVALTILRHGHRMEINAVLANRKAVERKAWSEHYTVPDPHARPIQQSGTSADAPSKAGKRSKSHVERTSRPSGTLPYTGIELERMSLQLSRYFGVADSKGLLARSIDPNSPGSRAGLKAGDVICQANGVPVTSREGWDELLKENRGQTIRLKILRHRHPRTILLAMSDGRS